uniref:hypothetical protein n=1 Tax=Exiguobacterium sp. S3-2 TaxID=1389960 RepID=UPI00159ED1D1|nr:hypothetical protein [Exiguobacterium sp. S3-2]
MRKTASSDVAALLVSAALALLIGAIYIIFSGKIIPAYLILGISVFTAFLSVADLVNLLEYTTYDENNAKDQKNIRSLYTLRSFAILISIPVAIVLGITLDFKGRTEEEIGNAANVFTLLSLAIVLIAIAVRSYSTSIMREPTEKK